LRLPAELFEALRFAVPPRRAVDFDDVRAAAFRAEDFRAEDFDADDLRGEAFFADDFFADFFADDFFADDFLAEDFFEDDFEAAFLLLLPADFLAPPLAPPFFEPPFFEALFFVAAMSGLLLKVSGEPYFFNRGVRAARMQPGARVARKTM
jgi:hypothetical protein